VFCQCTHFRCIFKVNKHRNGTLCSTVLVTWHSILLRENQNILSSAFTGAHFCNCDCFRSEIFQLSSSCIASLKIVTPPSPTLFTYCWYWCLFMWLWETCWYVGVPDSLAVSSPEISEWSFVVHYYLQRYCWLLCNQYILIIIILTQSTVMGSLSNVLIFGTFWKPAK
jgi:hypothetical protein